MKGDIFIVRSDAGQAWHVRLAAQSSEPLSASEQLVAREGAEENVLAQARCFGFDQPRLTRLSGAGGVQEWLLHSGASLNGRPLPEDLVIAIVHSVDERGE